MKKILIVDDTSVNRVILKQTLPIIGDYIVIEATDGHEAIKKYKEEKPDLILMDIMMPDMDGCQAATEVQKILLLLLLMLVVMTL